MAQHADIAIVGGGIVGLCAAFHALRLGRRVIILERDQGTGLGASTVAAAVLSRTFRAPRGPLWDDLFPAALSEHKRLQDEWLQDIHTAWRWTGRWTIGMTPSDEDRLEQVHRVELEAGEAVRWLRADELAAMSLAFGGSIPKGYWNPAGGWVHTGSLLRGLAARVAECGAHTISATEVEHICDADDHMVINLKDYDIHANEVIIACGADSSRFGSPFGFTVQPQKGQLIRIQRPAAMRWNGPLYLPSGEWLLARDDDVVIGSTREDRFGSRVATLGAYVPLARFASSLGLITNVPLSEVSVLTGYRPMSTCGLPLLCRDPERPRVWWASGLGSDGILLGPIAGRMVVEAMCGVPCPLWEQLQSALNRRFVGSA